MKGAFHNRTTGPTAIPPAVRKTMTIERLNHRTKEFGDLFEDTSNKLKKILATDQAPILLTTSGTGALEATLSSLISTTDNIASFSNGVYGDLFATIAGYYVTSPIYQYRGNPTEAITPSKIKDILITNKFDFILLTHNESSTGILNPLEELCKTIKKYSNAMILVDAISSIGVTPFLMNDWGIDAVITATQKGLMSPPGLSIINLSQRAQKIIIDKDDSQKKRSHYFNLAAYIKAQEKKQTPFTPAISIIAALNTALDLLLTEGLENVYQRHILLANQFRDGLSQLNYSYFPQDQNHYSPGSTVIQLEDEHFSFDIQKQLASEFKIYVSTGLSDWQSSTLRIGHMGWVNEEDITIALMAFEIIRR